MPLLTLPHTSALSFLLLPFSLALTGSDLTLV